MMISLSLDSDKMFKVVGRGTVWVVDNGRRHNFHCGDHVIINDREYKILGVEMATHCETIGLNVVKYDDVDKK